MQIKWFRIKRQIQGGSGESAKSPRVIDVGVQHPAAASEDPGSSGEAKAAGHNADLDASLKVDPANNDLAEKTAASGDAPQTQSETISTETAAVPDQGASSASVEKTTAEVRSTEPVDVDQGVRVQESESKPKDKDVAAELKSQAPALT